MDIGTAKPTAAERAAAPHHLIDILDPPEPIPPRSSATDALRLIAEIQRARHAAAAGRRHDAVLQGADDGLDDLPAADADVRARTRRRRRPRSAGRRCTPSSRAVDPQTAARLAPNDAQRIQRALEVFIADRPADVGAARGAARQKRGAAVRFVPIALEPSDRARAARSASRALRRDAGARRGFVDEVRALRARGDLHLDLPSMRCVGYRQAWEYLDGAIDHAALRDKGIAATRQLGKRQLTWLRAMPERIVIDCCAEDATQQRAGRRSRIAGG